jgi:membrane protein
MAVARRLLASLKNDGVWLRSAGVAYCIVFALIPGFSAPMILYGMFGNADAVQRPVGFLAGLLPPDAIKFLADQLEVVAQTSRLEVGAGLSSAFLAALWASWSGASGIIAAINSAYREENHGHSQEGEPWRSSSHSGQACFFLLPLPPWLCFPCWLRVLQP